MSRGGGRGGRGGRGGGRGGFGGGASMPPMGLTFADIQNMPREAAELYPTIEPLPLLTQCTDEEKEIARLQIGFTTRLKKSQYYVFSSSKSTDVPRYSDKYRPSPASRSSLRRQDLHAPFFPQGLFEDYFNPKKKRKADPTSTAKKKINLDEFGDEVEEENSGEERSQIGSDAEASDYDVDEEYDNDYAENYFDNGEGDDMDDLGGGGGGDDGGGDYD